ncbi:hypothetical protein Ctob_002158, partial [Chrysochromulina tobinii]
ETAIHTCSHCLHKHFLQLQLKSTPALHRISHRFFPCISHAVVLEVELGQDRVDLQRLCDRLGTLNPDGVEPEVEGGHHRVDLQCLHDRLGTIVADPVDLEVNRGQHRVDLQRLRDCLGTLIPDAVSREEEGGQHRVDLQHLRDRLGTLVPDAVASEVEGVHHRIDLQRLRDRLGTINADLAPPEVQGGHDRVDLQRLRDRDGSLRTDLVPVQAQSGQDRVDLHRLRDRLGTIVADGVGLEVHRGQHRVDLQRLSYRLGTLFADLVAAELELGHHRVDLERLAECRCALRTDLVPGEVERSHGRKAGQHLAQLDDVGVAPLEPLEHERVDVGDLAEEGRIQVRNLAHVGRVGEALLRLQQAPDRFRRRRRRPTPRAHAREPVVGDARLFGPVGARHRLLGTLGEVEAQEAGLDGGADGGLDVAPARVLVRLREGRLARSHTRRKPLRQLTLHPYDGARVAIPHIGVLQALGEELRLGSGARRLVQARKVPEQRELGEAEPVPPERRGELRRKCIWAKVNPSFYPPPQVEVELGDRRHDAEVEAVGVGVLLCEPPVGQRDEEHAKVVAQRQHDP